MENSFKISVLGAGAWGTSISSLLADNGSRVGIWSIAPEVTAEINQEHTNRDYVPGIKLSEKIWASASLEEILEEGELIYVVLPAQTIREVMHKIRELRGENFSGNFVICSKGVEQKTFKLLSQVIGEVLPNSVCAVLSGPNFAREVAEGIPTITTIATEDRALYEKISKAMDCENFKTYYSSDVVGTQICGIAKNIIAIGCGIVDGLGWGRNTAAALITKGLNEMALLTESMGGSREIIFQPAGIGDLVLTCTSTKSRNMSLGFSIGKGTKPEELIDSKKATFEGFENAKSITKIAENLGIELPLCTAVHKILDRGATPEEAKKILMETI